MAGKSPLKSGRRRVVMVVNHGNIEFSDIDTVKMDDHPYGRFRKIRNENSNFNISAIGADLNGFTTRIYVGANFGRSQAGHKERHRLLLEVNSLNLRS